MAERVPLVIIDGQTKRLPPGDRVVPALTLVSASTSQTASTGNHYLYTTAGADRVLTLPAAPSAGDIVAVTYVAQTVGDVVTLAHNGKTIDGALADLVLYIADVTTGRRDYVELVYDGSGWIRTQSRMVAHGIHMSLSTAQALAGAATWTVIEFDTTDTATGLAYDATGDRVEIRRSGYYAITGSAMNASALADADYFVVKIANAATTSGYAQFRTTHRSGASNFAGGSATTSRVHLPQGTTIDVSVITNNGTAGIMNTAGLTGGATFLSIQEQA